jgi:hypothetical protein
MSIPEMSRLFPPEIALSLDITVNYRGGSYHDPAMMSIRNRGTGRPFPLGAVPGIAIQKHFVCRMVRRAI